MIRGESDLYGGFEPMPGNGKAMRDISICASKTPSGHVPGRSSISREEQRRRSLAFLAVRDDERRPVPLLDEDWDELPINLRELVQ